MAETAAPARSPWHAPQLWLGLLLLACHLVALLLPPGPTALAPVGPDASLLARLFPGTPAVWLLLRLCALGGGALLLASALPEPPRLALPAPGDPRAAPGALAFAAGVFAAAQLGGLVLVPRLSPWGQLAWVLALAVPPLLIHADSRRAGAGAGARARAGRALPRGARRQTRLAAAGTAGLVGAWIAIRVPLLLHAPRTAVPVDLWHAFDWFLDAVANRANVLVHSGQPGVANTFMLALGFPVFAEWGWVPSLAWVQLVGALWIGGTALLLAWLAWRVATPSGAVIAPALFLASPFVLLLTTGPAPFGVFTTLAVALPVGLVAFHASGSLAALTALAVVAGLATSTAYLFPAVAVAGLLVAVRLTRRPPPRAWLYWTLPLLSFLAAAGPTLPGPQALGELTTRYVAPRAEWATLEALMFAQRPASALTVDDVWFGGRPGPLDVALGSLLSPFAAPRSSFRLWADSLFDPIGVALAAIGLALCVRAARSHASSRWLLALWLASLLPAAASSAYDRASLTRNLMLPMAMGLLAAVGFDGLRRGLAPRASPRAVLASALGVALAMVAAGFALFDGVNPRLLPASATAIHLEALGDAAPEGGALLLEQGPVRVDWLHVAEIGRFLPRRPVPSRPYRGEASLLDPATGRPAAGLILWSPALERAAGVAGALCRRFPDATLFRLHDVAGLSTAWAARPAGPGWTPALPPRRWERFDCTDRASRRSTLARHARAARSRPRAGARS